MLPVSQWPCHHTLGGARPSVTMRSLCPAGLMGAGRGGGGRRVGQEPQGEGGAAPGASEVPTVKEGRTLCLGQDGGPACLPQERSPARCGQCWQLPLLTCSIRRGRERYFPSRQGFLAPAHKLSQCPVPRTSGGIFEMSSSPDGSLRSPRWTKDCGGQQVLAGRGGGPGQA